MEQTIEINFADFELTESKNIEILNDVFKKEIKIFKEFFDLQVRLFQNHFHGFIDPYYCMQEYERIVMQSFFKINHLLFTAHKLTLKGNYGAANILLRQIFEFLILGKYVSIIKKEEMALKWLDQKQFDVYDRIIKLLEKPNKKSFHDFWIIVCTLAHATTASHQINLNASDNLKQIRECFSLLLLLQRCNYHLLSICIINKRISYHSEVYGNFKSENSILKKTARVLKKDIYALFSSTGTQLIKDYESKWSLKK